MPRRERWPQLLLVAFWAALYLPHLFGGQTLPARDVGATQIPWRVVWRDQVRAGSLPLWDPYSNQGRPMLANPNTMAAYPGTLLFLAMTPEAAAGWHVALHHLLLLLGCYRLARRSGAGTAGSAVAAAAVGTCGVVWSSLTFLNFQASLAWAVWSLSTAVPVPCPGRDAVRRSLAGGALAGLSFLGGEPVTAALAVVAWVVVVAATWRPRPWVAAGAMAAAAALVAAPVLVPLLAIFPETVRGSLGAAAGALGADALAPRRLLELVFPNLLGVPLGDASTGFWAAASFPWQRYYPLIFLGATTLVCLPLAGLARRRLAPWWALVAAGAFGAAILALPAVAHGARALPAVTAARYAIKLLVLVVLALPPLVAAGWEALAAGWARRGRRWVRSFSLVSLLLAPAAIAPSRLLRPALAALYPASRAALARVPDADLRRSALLDSCALALPPVAILLAGPSALAATAATLAANLAAGSGALLFADDAVWAATPPARAALPEPAVVAVLAVPEPVPGTPLERFLALHRSLIPESGTRWGVAYVLARGPDGLEPVAQELLAAAADSLSLPERAHVAGALGATAVLATAPLAGWDGTSIGNQWIGRAGTPAAGAYLARRLLPAEGALPAATTMAAGSFTPGEDAVVPGRGGARPAGGGTVLDLGGPPHRRRFLVDASGAGLLVVPQSYMRCWRAWIDGRSATVEPVNGACLGVVVPSGRHRVELALDLTPYRIGAAGPLLLLLVAVLIRGAGSSRVRAASSGDVRRTDPATRPVPSP